MSTEVLLRINCGHCGNPLSFPAEYLNLQIDCPHCHGSVVLQVEEKENPTGSSEYRPRSRVWRWPIMAAFGLGLLVIWILLIQVAAVHGLKITEEKLLPGEYPDYYCLITLRNDSTLPLSNVVLLLESGESEPAGKFKIATGPLDPGELKQIEELLPPIWSNYRVLKVSPRPHGMAYFQWPF